MKFGSELTALSILEIKITKAFKSWDKHTSSQRNAAQYEHALDYA